MITHIHILLATSSKCPLNWSDSSDTSSTCTQWKSMPLIKGGLVSMTTKGCVQKHKQPIRMMCTKQKQTCMLILVPECNMSVPAVHQWAFRHTLHTASAPFLDACQLCAKVQLSLNASMLNLRSSQWSKPSPVSLSLSPRTTNEISIFRKFSSLTGNTPDKYNLSGNTSLKSMLLKGTLDIKYTSTALIIRQTAADNENLL